VAALPKRNRLALIVAPFGFALFLVFTAGAAAAAPADSPTTTLVTISGDFAFSGAVITGPGMAKPRTLSAYQSAVYMQSWLGSLYSGAPVTRRNPPPALPVYEVDVTGNWGGSIETRATFYASDGRRVWIAFPAVAPLTSTPGTRPAVIRGWFVALPRVKQAFAGTAKLVETGGTQSVPTSTTPTTATPDSSDNRSGGADIGSGIAILAAAAAVAAIIFGLVRRKAGQRVRPNPPK
jgi:hypothetical protein